MSDRAQGVMQGKDQGNRACHRVDCRPQRAPLAFQSGIVPRDDFLEKGCGPLRKQEDCRKFKHEERSVNFE